MGEDAPPTSEIIFYQTEDGRSRVQVRLQDGTAWLSQRQLADLYQKDVRTISEHIQTIYAEAELVPEATIRKFRIVQAERSREVTRLVDYYDLRVVLAVGYRVSSPRGTEFRRWATERLNDLLVKGFVLDDERLKAGRGPGPDYFDELLERIRDIRASEKRFYQKICDLYALAADYDPKSHDTQQFFRIVQNKLHWAVTGKTAAEIIAERANPAAPNMGLTTWKGAKVRKPDVTVAKNYLNENEMRQLNRIVTSYLDYAEDQAERRRVLYMADWRTKLDAFLVFNERDVLADAGKVSMAVAAQLATERYDAFHARRLAREAEVADTFDAETKQLTKAKKGNP